MKNFRLIALLLMTIYVFGPLAAEEGMWPFNMIPYEKIKEDYGIELSEDWVEHVQKASLRISFGGSGSFVSSNGLVITNHHVGSRGIYDLSTADRNLLEAGFLAHTYEEELKCPNLHVDQLVLIHDVTDLVNRDVSTEFTSSENEKNRLAAIAKIKSDTQSSSGLYPEIVTLYGGAKYHLYLYKRFTDVRLVMAPEKSIAFFGGNPDNFEYPRYDLDVCFFRVYENDRPYIPSHYLFWSESGPVENEPLFVSGHPGKTSRLVTADHLSFFHRVELPFLMDYLDERIHLLEDFGSLSPENKRIASQDLFRLYNTQKVYQSCLRSLNDPALLQKKSDNEAELIAMNSEPWEKLKSALSAFEPYFQSYALLEGSFSRLCRSFQFAKLLVRFAEERSKPNEERLREYVDSEIPGLERELLTAEPIYRDLEKKLLQDSFGRLRRILKDEHPAVRICVEGNSLQERAQDLIDSTQLFDLEYRRFLFNNLDEVEKSGDKMILLAKALDPIARAFRKQMEDALESIQKESYAEIAKIRFEKFKETVYPDATFTLRLSIGAMKGYQEMKGTIKPFTLLGGTYDHARGHGCQEPYRLPHRWMEKEAVLNKGVPFNFISTNDLIGGNSGSPVINAKGEIVGVVFDGNEHSLIWNYEFSDKEGRAVSVHSSGIIECLDKIYNAQALIRELLAP